MMVDVFVVSVCTPSSKPIFFRSSHLLYSFSSSFHLFLTFFLFLLQCSNYHALIGDEAKKRSKLINWVIKFQARYKIQLTSYDLIWKWWGIWMADSSMLFDDDEEEGEEEEEEEEEEERKKKKEDDDRLQQQDAARRIVRRVHPSCNCAPRSPQFSSSDSFQIPLLLFYLPVFILVNIFNTIHCSINTCYKITGIGNRTGATPAPSAEIFQTDLNWQITRIATRIIASILTTWQYGKCVTHTHTLKMNPADAQWIFFLMRISWWWREDTVAGTFIRNADRPRYYRNHGRLFKCYALDYEFIYYLSFKCASWLSSSRLSALGNWRGRLFIDSVRIPRRWRLMNNWSEHRIIISVRKWLP